MEQKKLFFSVSEGKVTETLLNVVHQGRESFDSRGKKTASGEDQNTSGGEKFPVGGGKGKTQKKTGAGPGQDTTDADHGEKP